MAELSRAYLRRLVRAVEEQFNLSELQILCLHIWVEFENIEGSTRADKARELILHLQRHQEIGALLAYCEAERPNFSWQPTDPTDVQVLLEANPLGLDILGYLLAPALRETFARLHQVPSADVAKELAFSLYVVLDEMELRTEGFVGSLRALTAATAQSSPNVAEIQSTLLAASNSLMDMLPQVVELLNAVNPQLELYEYTSVRRIERYRSRMRLLSELEIQARAAGALQAEQLQQLVQRAEANSVLIKEATSQLRTFLAAEFPFRESF